MKQAPDRDEIIRTIIRFMDDYGWSRTVVKKVINRKFGTRYFEQDIQSMYDRKK